MDSNFDDIIRDYYSKIYRFVYSFVRNEHDADDIVQNVFINAHKGIEKFRGDSSLYTWLTRIAINGVKSHYRKKKLYSLFQQSEEGDIMNEPRDDSQNTERSAETNILLGKVGRAIGDLPMRQKQVFVMKHINGMSIAEIVDVLRIPEGSVKSNIFKAVRNLRKYLGGTDEV
jgi:RNA polymerase sigma-70 factor (ECF subfamily)